MLIAQLGIDTKSVGLELELEKQMLV